MPCHHQGPRQLTRSPGGDAACWSGESTLRPWHQKVWPCPMWWWLAPQKLNAIGGCGCGRSVRKQGQKWTTWTAWQLAWHRYLRQEALRLDPRLYQGLYSLSGKTSYRPISWSLEAARLDVAMVVSLWNLTGTSAAVLPRYLPNFRAIGKV